MTPAARILWPAAGSAVWTVIAGGVLIGWTGVGAAESLFLLAPLVVVPLGLGLWPGLRTPGLPPAGPPLGAACAAASFCLDPGPAAALLASGWLAVSALYAWQALVRVVLERRRRASDLCFALGCLDLAVGGVWLVLSRGGLTPLGFGEPIVLLTAVHFHFAGFGAAAWTAAALGRLERPSAGAGYVRICLAAGTVAGPPLLALGFLAGCVLKMAAALLLSVCLAALAAWTIPLLPWRTAPLPSCLVAASGTAVVAGMALAGVYALAEFRGEELLSIPRMVRLHGALNGLGFSACGLLGWRAMPPAGDS